MGRRDRGRVSWDIEQEDSDDDDQDRTHHRRVRTDDLEVVDLVKRPRLDLSGEYEQVRAGGDREASRRLEVLRVLVGVDVFEDVFRSSSWQAAVLRARSVVVQSVPLVTGTRLMELDDRRWRKLLVFELSDQSTGVSLDCFTNEAIARVAELDVAIRNAALFFSTLYGPEFSCIRDLQWSAFQGRLLLRSMKQISYLRFARVLLPPHGTVDTSIAQWEMAQLFDISAEDREVHSLMLVDMASIIEERVRPSSARPQSRGDGGRGPDDVRVLGFSQVCASVAGGFACPNKGCRFSHERAAFDKLPAAERERLHAMAGRMADRGPGRKVNSRAAGGRLSRFGPASRVRSEQKLT